MKISLVILRINRKLPRGGAERVLVDLANELARRDHEVTVFCTDVSRREDFMYPLAGGVQFCNLRDADHFVNKLKIRVLDGLVRLGHLLYSRFVNPGSATVPDSTTFIAGKKEKAVSRWMRYVHHIHNSLLEQCFAIERKQFDRYKPEVLVFFKPSYLFTKYAAGSVSGGSAVVLSLHGPLERTMADYRNNPAERKRFQAALKRADAVTVLLPDIKTEFPQELRGKVHIIPNPMLPVTADKRATPGEETDHGTILAVGRLALQKNHEVLVRAFAGLHEKYPRWQVKIFGEGELRDELTGLIQELGLHERVLLMGDTIDLSPHYRSVHIFAMSSRFEGFPLTLGEAMAHGLPAVGFDKARGVNALIEPGRNGLLATADNPLESLAENLEKLMLNPGLRAELGRGGIQTAERYAPEAVYDLWENTLSEVVKNRG